MGIKFISTEHKNFYNHYIQKCRVPDANHRALIYCLGIDAGTRKNVHSIYDFHSGLVKTECLHDSWQTSGSMKTVRLAFNLYCNAASSVYDYDDPDEQLRECQCYTVKDLFCCGYAKYFLEAIKIRYAEYL